MSGTITGELRELLADINWTEIIDHMRLNCGSIVDGDWLDSWHAAADHACDAIDAVHANLERENESLRRELDRVLGEQEDERHTAGESITGELRAVAAKTECANGRCEKLYRGDLEHIADRIDAEHEAQLNDAFETRNSDENLESDGWVRKEEGKTISAYYVDVVPRFDWKLMALELEQFAEIVRGMAGDDE